MLPFFIPQKLEETDEEKQLNQEAETCKGKAFSTEGICTLGRFWKNYAIYSCIIFILGDILDFLISFSGNTDIFEILSKEHFVFLAIFFWYIFVYSFLTIYIGFLKIKRFRSVDFNPWLVLVPVFSQVVVSFCECKKDFQNNKYFKGKIKCQPLLISIMIIIQVAFAVLLLVAPLLHLIKEV